jgi:hypothetical protein
LEWVKIKKKVITIERRRSASGSSMDAHTMNVMRIGCMKRQCSGRQMGRRNERLDVLTGREPAEEMRHSRGQALGGGSKSTLMLNSSHLAEKKDTLEGEKKSGKEKCPTPLQSFSLFFNGWNLLNRIEGEPLFFFFYPRE